MEYPTEKPQPRKNNDLLIVLAIVAVGLCCLCILAIAAYFFFAPMQTAAPLPTATNTPEFTTLVPAVTQQIVIAETETPTATNTLPPTQTVSPVPPTETPVFLAMPTAKSLCNSHLRHVYIYITVENGEVVYYSSDICLVLTKDHVGTPFTGEYDGTKTVTIGNYSYYGYKFHCPIVKRESTCGLWVELNNMTIGLDPRLDWSVPLKPGDYNKVFLIGNPTATPTITGMP